MTTGAMPERRAGDKRRKIVMQRTITAALGILISLTSFFYFTFKQFHEVQLGEKFQDKQFQTDTVLDGVQYFVDARHNWDTQEEYKEILIGFVTKLDTQNQNGVYAELFDKDFNSLSKRTPLFDTFPFDPRKYDNLLERLTTEERGVATVNYASHSEALKHSVIPHEINLYFRWVPMGNDIENKLLVIVGISRFSVNNYLGMWIILGIAGIIIFSEGCLIYAIYSRRR